MIIYSQARCLLTSPYSKKTQKSQTSYALIPAGESVLIKHPLSWNRLHHTVFTEKTLGTATNWCIGVEVQSTLGGRHFCPTIMYEKLTKCRNSGGTATLNRATVNRRQFIAWHFIARHFIGWAFVHASSTLLANPRLSWTLCTLSTLNHMRTLGEQCFFIFFRVISF